MSKNSLHSQAKRFIRWRNLNKKAPRVAGGYRFERNEHAAFKENHDNTPIPIDNFMKGDYFNSNRRFFYED